MHQKVTQWMAITRGLPDHGLPPDASIRVLCFALPDLSVWTIRSVAVDDQSLRELKQDLEVKTWNKSQASAGRATERELLSMINNYRSMLGRARLRGHDPLRDIADLHTAWMKQVARASLLEEEGERHSPQQRAVLGQVDNWSGECCIRGLASAKLIFKDLLRRPADHRNLLHADHRQLGVGQDDQYWDLVFAGTREFTENLGPQQRP